MKMETSQSAVAQGAQEARRQAMPVLIRTTVRAVLNDAVNTVLAEEAKIARELTLLINDQTELQRAFLREHGTQPTCPRQTLDQYQRFVEALRSRRDEAANPCDQVIMEKAKEMAHQTITTATDSLLEATGDPARKHSSLGAMARGRFTEPVAISPPGGDTITTESWTDLWRKTVIHVLDRHTDITLPVISRNGKRLVTIGPAGTPAPARAPNADGALRMTREILRLTGEEPALWSITYRDNLKTRAPKKPRVAAQQSPAKPQQRPLLDTRSRSAVDAAA